MPHRITRVFGLALVAGALLFNTGCADNAAPDQIVFDDDIDGDLLPEGPTPGVEDAFVDSFDRARIQGINEPSVAFLLSRVPPSYADETGSYCITDLAVGWGCVMAAPMPLSRQWQGDDISLLLTRLSVTNQQSCLIVRDPRATPPAPGMLTQAWADENIVDYSMDSGDRASVQVQVGSATFYAFGVTNVGGRTQANRSACQAGLAI